MDNNNQIKELSTPAASVDEIENKNAKDKLVDVSPATLQALKTLSSLSTTEGIEKLNGCQKLTASLEQIRATRNVKLLEKLDKIRQDFTGLNNKITQMEESIMDLKEVTKNLVKSLPPDREATI